MKHISVRKRLLKKLSSVSTMNAYYIVRFGYGMFRYMILNGNGKKLMNNVIQKWKTN
jgi:hypothetical protein